MHPWLHGYSTTKPHSAAWDNLGGLLDVGISGRGDHYSASPSRAPDGFDFVDP
jgi:hypothetical protein